jgi:hypothetical protein
MTTSGVTGFAFTRDNIITMALNQIGVYSKNAVIDNNDLVDATRALNLLLLAWQNIGLSLSRIQDCYLFTKAGQASYTLGGPSSENITENYTQTKLSTSAAAGAGTVTMVSAAGLSIGMFVGVMMDGGIIHWTTTTNAVNPVGLTVVMAGAAAAGNAVYVYATKIQRPLRVISARRRTSGGYDIPISVKAREDYNNLPNKKGSGSPLMIYYDPRRETYGTLYAWLTPKDEKEIICLTVIRPIEVFTAGNQTPDLPAEFYDALVSNLALKLANEYHEVSPEIYAKIQEAAAQSLMAAHLFDNELASIQFEPER